MLAKQKSSCGVQRRSQASFIGHPVSMHARRHLVQSLTGHQAFPCFTLARQYHGQAAGKLVADFIVFQLIDQHPKTN